MGLLMKLIDRVGQRYERLLVIERAPNKSERDTNARWLCQCDCGNTCVAYGQDLKRGKFKSCGCMNIERITKHGKAGTHVYGVWKMMLQRCENPNSPSFHNYGGRGIEVCPEWHDFEVFVSDMGDRPLGYSIDRKDNDLGYTKGNCRWASSGQQSNNTRRNREIEFNGKTLTLQQWAEETEIKWHTLRQRIDRLGWSVERALTTPIKVKGV